VGADYAHASDNSLTAHDFIETGLNYPSDRDAMGVVALAPLLAVSTARGQPA